MHCINVYLYSDASCRQVTDTEILTNGMHLLLLQETGKVGVFVPSQKRSPQTTVVQKISVVDY